MKGEKIMSKEIQSYKGTGGDVLHEQREPLFNSKMKRRYPLVLRAALRVFFLTVVILVFVLAWKHFKDEEPSDFDNGGYLPPSAETESGEEEKPFFSDTSKQTCVESEAETEEETQTESESEPHEDSSQNQEQSIASVDISELEFGEEYIVNDTDKDIDLYRLLKNGFSYNLPTDSATPLVLILHTYTSEDYIGFDEETKGLKTVVSVGEVLSARLNSLGVPTVHCTVIHDGGKKTNAYASARETVKTMLEIYPDVRCIIDLQRMSITDGEGNALKTLASVPEPSAQIRMTVSGFESSKRDWRQSLSMALVIRRELNRDGDGICAPVHLSNSRYNSDMCDLYLTAEVGAEGNSVKEAKIAGERLAVAIAETLFPQKNK